MRQINIPERFFDLLKKAKIKIMIGGVLGVITLSGGTATISYAQDDKSISSETDDNLENDIKQNLSIDGYRYEDGVCDIGVALLDGLNEDVEYIYDLYMVDDLGNVIKQINKDVPFGTTSVVREEGKYYAVVKEKETEKIYGTTSIVDTKNLQLGGEQIYEARSLTTITETGGALTGKWYDEYARNLSNKTGIDYEMIKDTIVNLHLDKIDETQIPVLYPEEINYTKLEESTDYVLWNLSEHVNTEVSDFAANKIDLEILSNLDSKYIQAYNDVKINPSIEAPDIVDCLNFFLANGEINGYKFTQLTDTGKKLALVSYDRFRDLAQTFISYYENSEIATNGEIPSVFRTADGMNTLSIATYLEANRLISGYYEFIRGCTDSMGIVSFNVDGELEYQINKIESENKAKGFKGNLNKIKSMFLVNYLKDLNVQTTINSFNQTININEEFENAEYYLDSVLKHNATYDVSKNISLVNVCHETDRYDIAYLESFYRTMKYEIETNQVNKEHVSSILRWVLEYYQGTYLDNPGVEVRYVDHLTNGGMLVASNILNQYKILIKNLDTQDPTIKDLIERIDNISLWQECKASEQWIYTYYEQLQPNLNYYTVKKGDTLSNIARMYNVNIFELVRLNNIENPDLILPGEKLKINPQYNYDEEFSR